MRIKPLLNICFFISSLSFMMSAHASDSTSVGPINSIQAPRTIFETTATFMCNGSTNGWATYTPQNIYPVPTAPLTCPAPQKLKISAVPLEFWANTTLLVGGFTVSGNNVISGSMECHGLDSTHQGMNQEQFTLVFYCTD
jgi:hypothetical protein